MIFLISRASDYYRDCEMPSKDIPPHELAKWDEALKEWTIDFNKLPDIIQSLHARFIIRKEGKLTRFSIDDVFYE